MTAPADAGRQTYPPDPPTVEEIITVMRADLRIREALGLSETDLDPDRGSLIVRHGKGDERREVGMDRWAWTHLNTVAPAVRAAPAQARSRGRDVA